MLKTFEYRIYPNKQQEILLAKHFGCNRFIYNWALNKKIVAYETENCKLSCFDLNKMITQMKKQDEFSWLNEVHSQSLQQSMAHLDLAFTKFFREKSGFPKFKKKSEKQSYQIAQYIIPDFENNKIHIPKLKKIKCIFHRRFEGKIKTCTIKKSNTHKYFVCILVETSDVFPVKEKITKETTVGVDLGIRNFAVCSNGHVIENPKFLNKSLQNLKVNQRRLSKKQKGSSRYNRQKLKVNKIYEKIKNKRDDFLHKVSYQITHENQVSSIAMENLSIKEMLMKENSNLNRYISDCSWSSFRNYIHYKCDWYGKNHLIIGQFDPSSKICNVCGFYHKDLKRNEYFWICPNCKIEHDRDINAAINIRNFAIQQQNIFSEQEVLVEPVEISSIEESTKQEARRL